MTSVFPSGDNSRATGQLVFGELHRALRLVNEVTARLRDHGSRCSSPDWTRGSSSVGSSRGSLDEAGLVSFSPSMLDQLGSDLLEQLKIVMATITEMLQNAPSN